MKTTTGTSHFVDLIAARRYYADQEPVGRGSREHVAKLVAEKLNAGEIHLGKPATKPGETISIIPGEGRYAITSA